MKSFKIFKTRFSAVSKTFGIYRARQRLSSEETVRKLLVAAEDQFRASDDVGYTWVIDYSKSRIKYFKKSIERLEKKAGDRMKYLAGGAALLGALFSYEPIKDHAVFFVPCGLALLAASLSATRTTFPEPHAASPTIKEAFDTPIFVIRTHKFCLFDRRCYLNLN